jgi:glycosyl transferase family 25
MHDINEVFPHKVCINLDRRPERWRDMCTKFERCGIRDVQRFAAVDGQHAIVPPDWLDSPGAYGCLRSHLDVIEEARKLGWPNVLIFEDDAALEPQLAQNFETYFPQVPSDWDMLHFGANHMAAPIEVSKNVLRITSANSTFAYALNRSVFDSFIELNSRSRTAVDLNNRTLQAEHACYCFTPHLAWVEDAASDVQVRDKYHWYLKESLVLFGAGMDRVLHETSVIIAYQNRTDNHLKNLSFLIRFYQQYLPGITVIVVEQGAAPTLEQSSYFKYLFLPDAGPLDRCLCFNSGMKLTDDSFLIFSDSDIFVEEWDIRGNLRICEQYDCATGFRSIIHLTETATQTLRTSKPMLLTPWFNANDYPRTSKHNLFEKFYIFNRKGIAKKEPRVFDSPNDALQLS